MEEIQIKVTSETLVTISNDVEQKISKVKTALEDLESIINKSNSYWEGMGQEAFVNSYKIRKDDYKRILRSFSDHIVNLQQIAGVYQETENTVTDFSEDLAGDVII